MYSFSHYPSRRSLHVQKIAVSMTMAALLFGATVFPTFAATPKEVTLHHHKPISEEEMQSLENSAITNMKFGKLPTLQNE